jgi:hypothetical protein
MNVIKTIGVKYYKIGVTRKYYYSTTICKMASPTVTLPPLKIDTPGSINLVKYYLITIYSCNINMYFTYIHSDAPIHARTTLSLTTYTPSLTTYTLYLSPLTLSITHHLHPLYLTTYTLHTSPLTLSMPHSLLHISHLFVLERPFLLYSLAVIHINFTCVHLYFTLIIMLFY